jgi:hypothetical protein
MKGTVSKQVLAALCMLLVSVGVSAKDTIANLPFTGGQGEDGIGAKGAMVEVEPQGGSTIGRNLGIGALNMVLGLGSFLVQKDVLGGLTLLVGYAVAGGLIGWEMAMGYDDSPAGVPGTIGLWVAGGTVAYGFIRPFLYAWSQKVAEVLDGVRVSVLPEVRGRTALRLAYRWEIGE